MPDMEEIKRKAQNAVYSATEKMQDAAVIAGERAEELKGYTDEKAGELKGIAGGKAEALRGIASEKAEAFMDFASEKAVVLKSLAGGKAGELIDRAGEKIGALRDVAKANLALLSEKRNLEKYYQALGEWYAAQCGDNVSEGAADLLDLIRDSQAKIEALRGAVETGKTEQTENAAFDDAPEAENEEALTE